MAMGAHRNVTKWHLVSKSGTLLELRDVTTREGAREAQAAQNCVDKDERDWVILAPGEPDKRHVCWRVSWGSAGGRVVETASYKIWKHAAERWIAETLRNVRPVRFTRVVRTVKKDVKRVST